MVCKNEYLGQESADGITSFPRRIALADGGYSTGSKGTLHVLTEPILAVRFASAAISALRKRAVLAAVIVVSAVCSSRETFKSPVIAICKKHGIYSLAKNMGLYDIYNPFHGETHFGQQKKAAFTICMERGNGLSVGGGCLNGGGSCQHHPNI